MPRSFLFVAFTAARIAQADADYMFALCNENGSMSELDRISQPTSLLHILQNTFQFRSNMLLPEDGMTQP